MAASGQGVFSLTPDLHLPTNQFAAFGVTLSGEHYNSQGIAPFPGISGDYVGVSMSVPFSIFFNAPVRAAAFGYAKNPTTVLLTTPAAFLISNQPRPRAGWQVLPCLPDSFRSLLHGGLKQRSLPNG